MEYKNEEQENESDEEQTLDKTEREEAIPRSEVPLLTLSLTLSLSLILSFSFPNAITIASVSCIVIAIFIGFSGIFNNTVHVVFYSRGLRICIAKLFNEFKKIFSDITIGN